MRLIVLRDRRGRIGVGESSPLPGYSLDSEAADRFAHETAELDLFGQQRGVPVWRLLGGRDASPRAVSQLALNRRELHAALARGFRTIKVKDPGLASRARCYTLRIDLNDNRRWTA